MGITEDICIFSDVLFDEFEEVYSEWFEHFTPASGFGMFLTMIPVAQIAESLNAAAIEVPAKLAERFVFVEAAYPGILCDLSS